MGRPKSISSLFKTESSISFEIAFYMINVSEAMIELTSWLLNPEFSKSLKMVVELSISSIKCVIKWPNATFNFTAVI